MITVKPVYSNVLTRWPCDVCGGWTEKDQILFEAALPEPDDEGGLVAVFRVCEQCLQANDIDSLLEQNAQRYEAIAAQTRSFKGQVILPSKEEVAQANYLLELIDALYHQSHQDPVEHTKELWKNMLSQQMPPSERKILQDLIDMPKDQLLALGFINSAPPHQSVHRSASPSQSP
jgi:hypothetical protein